MQDDAALLREYAKTRSNAAFAELVQRHLNLVYSAALRQVGGDAHLAKDVSQSVFCALARKAQSAASVPVLAGWLHTSTHYAAAKIVRGERRRRAREALAQAMHETLNESARDAEWARLRPVLDAAIRRLRPGDRDAILLRFFEGEAFARIGARLSLSENAARMRVDRALEKLREQLTRRGIQSTSAALATVLAGQAVVAAPATLATTVTTAALAGTTGAGAVVSFFQFMAITKTQAVVAGALLLGGGAAVVQQERAAAALRAEIATLHAEHARLARLADENRQLAHSTAEIDRSRAAVADLPSLRAEAAALREKARVLTETRNATRGRAKNRTSSAAPDPSSTGVENPTPAPDHPPVLKSPVPPVFPLEMRRAGISGEAVVKVVIDANGDVRDVSIVRATHHEFEAAAVDAVKQWKFDPGAKGGRRVNTTTQIPIVFQIDPEEQNWF